MRAFPPAGTGGMERAARPKSAFCRMTCCWSLRSCFQPRTTHYAPRTCHTGGITGALATAPERIGPMGYSFPEQPFTCVAAGRRPNEAVMSSGVSPIRPRTHIKQQSLTFFAPEATHDNPVAFHPHQLQPLRPLNEWTHSRWGLRQDPDLP